MHFKYNLIKRILKEDSFMNNITKTAVCTSITALILLVTVILSGTSYPNYLFTFGTGSGLVLLFISILLFAVGWSHDFSVAFKQRNKYGILALLGVAIIVILPILVKYCLG